jgi:hypothetical protein
MLKYHMEIYDEARLVPSEFGFQPCVGVGDGLETQPREQDGSLAALHNQPVELFLH